MNSAPASIKESAFRLWQRRFDYWHNTESKSPRYDSITRMEESNRLDEERTRAALAWALELIAPTGVATPDRCPECYGLGERFIPTMQGRHWAKCPDCQPEEPTINENGQGGN